MNYCAPPRPDRIRYIEKPFAWIPFRMLTDGIFAVLSSKEKLLYIFLCLAADRQGISFWSDDRIRECFQISLADIHVARNELIKKDLIAYNGRLYQILSLPSVKKQNHPTITPINHADTPISHAEPELFADILKRLAK